MNVEQNLFLARVAEQAERFEDVVAFLVKVLGEKGADITKEERNILSVAFKNLISSKRSACRTIQAVEENPKYAKFSAGLTAYKKQIESLLKEDCDQVISIINDHVLTRDCEGEAKVFFVKMVGDYYRYKAENESG